MSVIRIQTPITEEIAASLRVPDMVLLSGTIYTARDRAHKRIIEMAEQGEPLPLDPKGQVLYYAGPSPTPPGKPVGAVGPTTSYRMDPFTEGMLALGFRAFIGKGKRSSEVRQAIALYRGVYFSTFGGAAAYLSKRVVRSSVIAFEEFGPEAIYRFEVKDFPVIVTNDMYGGDLYESALQQ